MVGRLDRSPPSTVAMCCMQLHVRIWEAAGSVPHTHASALCITERHRWLRYDGVGPHIPSRTPAWSRRPCSRPSKLPTHLTQY